MGTDVKTKIIEFNARTSAGSQVITGVGFAPKLILFSFVQNGTIMGEGLP